MTSSSMAELENLLPDIEVPLLRQVGVILTEVCRLGEMANDAGEPELRTAIVALMEAIEDCESEDLDLILRGIGAHISQIGHERFGSGKSNATA